MAEGGDLARLLRGWSSDQWLTDGAGPARGGRASGVATPALGTVALTTAAQRREEQGSGRRGARRLSSRGGEYMASALCSRGDKAEAAHMWPAGFIVHRFCSSPLVFIVKCHGACAGGGLPLAARTGMPRILCLRRQDQVQAFEGGKARTSCQLPLSCRMPAWCCLGPTLVNA
jgi:hypothetical protein